MGSSKLTEKQESYLEYLKSLASDLGYKESKKKEGLFYKPLKDGVLFLDFRKLTVPSGRIELMPQFYSNGVKEWIVNKEIQNNKEKYLKFQPKNAIRNGDIESRLSRFSGYCEDCGKDIGEDYLVVDHKREYTKRKVCKECFDKRIKYVNLSKKLPNSIENNIDKCPLCGKIGFKKYYRDKPPGFIDHHTSYEPEKTMLVCETCHGKIHQKDGFHDELEPDITREKWEKGNKKYKLIPCANPNCSHKKQLPVWKYKKDPEKYNNPENHTELCSRCENKKSIQIKDGEVVKVPVSRGPKRRRRYAKGQDYIDKTPIQYW